VDVLKFVKSHKYLQTSCHSTEVYIFCISHIYLLVIMYFSSVAPKNC